MTTWIALLRGINVGGNNPLPMKEFRAQLEGIKLKNVRTYIQSGNIVFESSVKSPQTLVKKIGDLIQTKNGFRPQILVLDRESLNHSIKANPFPSATNDPKSLHFFFLAEPAKNPNTDSLDDAQLESESYVLTDRVFYLHAPNGTGRSKLAANAEKHLGVVTTARNFRTVEKIVDLVEECKK